MSSMRDLFPFHDYQKKLQRNFIKENIRKAKGCTQCIAEKKAIEKSRSCKMSKTEKISASPERCLKQNGRKTPAIKCSVRMIKSEENSCKKYQESKMCDMNICSKGCQTEINEYENDEKVLCSKCGISITNAKNSSAMPVNLNQMDLVSKNTETENDGSTNKKYKDSHRVSHENEENTKKGANIKNDFDLSLYRKGEVPRYLKDRNAKLEKEEQERRNREKLEELLGLNDPKCPSGHMLMPREQLRLRLSEMETKFNSLIRELNRMPVSNDSFKIKQRCMEIEKELNNLESKIELYKTGKVFVKIPE